MDKKTVIDYTALRPMDIVFCGAHSLFAAAIRAVTGGARELFDHGFPNHAGIVVDFHGQFLIAEMLGSGLVVNSLEDYTKGKLKPYIISVARHPAFTDASREEAQRRIALDRRKTLEYDWGGDLAFIGAGKNDPNKAYCSEYAAVMLKEYCGALHPKNTTALDPASLWAWMLAQGWEVKNWKK